MDNRAPLEATGLTDYFGEDSDRSAVTGQPASESGEMTRSEERLRVETVTEAAGRVRLRKYIVTEDVTTTVTVSREEVRLERVPLTDDDRLMGAAEDLELGEVDYELVLMAERVVVTKEIVPVERIRLSKQVVTEERRVDETVRHEQIEADELRSDPLDT